MHFTPFWHDVGAKQLMGCLRAMPERGKVPLSIFGSGSIFGPHQVVEVTKGPKKTGLKNTLSMNGQIGNIFVKTANRFFKDLAK